MVKKLRNKFVIVTTSLMVSLFGGFLIINTIFNNYWNEIEIVEMLDWIACSGMFTNEQNYNASEGLIFDIVKDESPIIGMVLNQEGRVLFTRVFGNENRISIPENVLKEMFQNKGSKRKVGKYYYTYSRMDDDSVLLVIMKSSLEKMAGSRVVGIIVLVVGGISVLIGITFGLSGFVTKPAEQMLLREKRFISDAGHELKTPLGAISINAQALEMEYKDDKYIRNIISETGRMGRLLEKLLALARLDEQENVQFKSINLSFICEEMSLTYESVAYEKNIEFQYWIEPDLYIYGNEDEIRQLLAVLVDNAIKNTPEKGEIHLKCYETKHHKELSIDNSGKGIPEDMLPYIFERFYTSDESRTKGSFGLGLAIAKTIVDRHKGVITVDSRPSENTIFKIIF